MIIGQQKKVETFFLKKIVFLRKKKVLLKVFGDLKKRVYTGGKTVNLSQPVNHTGLKSGKRLTRAKKGQKVDSGLEIWGWSVYMDPKSQPFWDSIGKKVDSGQKK